MIQKPWLGHDSRKPKILAKKHCIQSQTKDDILAYTSSYIGVYAIFLSVYNALNGEKNIPKQVSNKLSGQ